jgi:hypothetical protein
MGEKIVELQKQALYVVDQSLPTFYGWLQTLPFDLNKLVYIGNHHPVGTELGGIMALSGTIFGIFLLFFGGIVVAYGEAIWNSGLTMIYIILYKNQEKENLLEREDEELQEEEEDQSSETGEPPPEEPPADATEDNQEAGEDSE